MRIAFLNDTHCGVRNSSDIFIQNQDDFYTKVFFPYLLENDIKHIIHLGDALEHRRFVNYKALNAHRLHFLEKLREYGITMDIVPGNHDIYFKNTLKVCALKELYGHYMNEITIHMDPTVLEFDGLKIGLVPWICEENEKEIDDFLRNCVADVIGGHFELNGFDMLRGVPCTHGMSTENLQRFELVLSGHYHCKSSQGNIHYFGSQMEFFWNDAHDDKFFHILDTDTRVITPVRNPMTLYEKVFYDDEKNDYLEMDLDHLDNKFVKIVVINKSDPFTFDRFLDRVQQRSIYELKIQEDFSEFLGTNVGDDGIEVEDTHTLLGQYIDNVETVLDKDRLKAEMSDLMTEAQSLEVA